MWQSTKSLIVTNNNINNNNNNNHNNKNSNTIIIQRGLAQKPHGSIILWATTMITCASFNFPC